MVASDLARTPAILAAKRRARGAEALAAPLGEPLHLLEVAGSTNDEAKQAARAGAPHGATWVAEEQTAGRGRQGRVWVSPRGENLLFSVLVRVSAAPARLPLLALAAGLGVKDAVLAAAPRAEPRIKWPNDVVTAEGRKKLAGVLVEATMAGDRVSAVVVGVGINVLTRTFPEEIAARASSIALFADRLPDRAEVLADVLLGLERDLPLVAARGLAPVHARLDAADALSGRQVENDRGERGEARGIDDEGRLVVALGDGTLARWSSGEVRLVIA